MNTMNAARHAYSRLETPSRSPRMVEYDLIARVTQRLTSAWAKRREDFSGFATALTDNQRLWSTLAADVAEPGNGLPQDLRAQLFYLYQFTVEHSRTVLDDKGSIEVLVDINTAVMKGLRGESGAP